MAFRVRRKRTRYDIREWLFLTYFCVMFAHISVPYLKFILFLLIIIYSIMILIKNKKLSTVSMMNLKICLAWYGIFSAFVYLSMFWQVMPRPEAEVMSTMIRILPICLCISYYINSEERLYKILDLFIISIVYTAILALLTSPIETYGTISFGGITSLYRNSMGHLCAIIVILSFYLFKITKDKKYFIPCLVCMITLLCTGSRGSLLALLFMIGIGFVLEKGIQKKIKWFFIGLASVILVVVLYFNIPYFQEVFGDRLLALFSDKYSDGGSASDRAYYVEVGKQMFLQRPILGWGIDNFAYYLRQFGHYSYEVYSHNNYIEILTSFGFIGFTLYYWLYVYILKHSLKRKDNFFIKAMIIIILRYFVFEYATITFIQYCMVFLLVILVSGLNVYRFKKEV